MSSPNESEELRPGEELIGEVDEFLYRQVHPQFVQDGRVTSQAFRPTEKDAGELSISRGSQVSAEEAFIFHTARLQLDSAGSWIVSVDEVGKIGLRAVDDQHAPTRPDPCPPGHGYIDFRSLQTQNALKKAASKLRDAAEVRGRAFPRTSE
ncbi:hypothetical protein [Actinomadura macrotermitis]|uniref:hypothetical protein n=1 Tax=Actinomadura macrotermitis TaxID=2585200 RepID=UPI00188667CF|nr:hypothetical protein [Actinomadura macrotermitis]